MIVALYVGLYGSMLVATHERNPYVTDGNESFSMLVHASNLYHFSALDDFRAVGQGLQCESPRRIRKFTRIRETSPRLFSLGLYVFGARGIESQIVITTFTIGLLSVWLIFVLRHRYEPGFAMAATSVFMTDYLFVRAVAGEHIPCVARVVFLSFSCLYSPR